MGPGVRYTSPMEPRVRGLLPWGVALVSSGLLLLATFQLQALESRMAVQSQQLRVLGETTERVVAELKRIRGGGGASVPIGDGGSDEYAGEKVRHPEVENHLKAKQTHWPPEGAATNGVLTQGWASGDPKGFNALLENSLDMRVLDNYTGSSLARPNRWTDPDAWYGDLAWRVEVTDDFKTYTSYLRKGVKWHPVAGVDRNDPRFAWLNKDHEVTAHDFVFYVDMLMHPQVENGFAKSYFAELESWKALDDYTFEVRWKKKQQLNLEESLGMSPLPKFLYTHNEDGSEIPKETLGLRFNQHWYNNKGIVGSGPYRFVEYTPGVQMRLERNEEYYGEKPAIKHIKFPIYTDPAQTVLKLKSGNIAFGALQPGQYRDEVLQYKDMPEGKRPKGSPFLDGTITCEAIPRLGYYYIGWNEDKPLFADKRVRRAMTLALNRQQIVDKVFVGLGNVAKGPYLEGTPSNAPEIEALPFDLKQAAALLKEAGWVDSDHDGLLDNVVGKPGPDNTKRVPFEFTFLNYGSSAEWASAANIFKEDLLSIGVKMNVESAEWSLMQKRMDEKQFDAFAGGWALSWSVDLYQIWHSSQADIPKGSNRVGFRNKRADALIEELRATLDPAKRTQLLQEFHRIVFDEQPYTFVMTRKQPACYRNVVKNVVYAKTNPVADALPWWSTQVDG
jgi:peptide/nickel transport system substrate-binding protein